MRLFLNITFLLFSVIYSQNKVKTKNLIQKGDSYIGTLVDGKRSGYGIYEYVSGNRYEGDWKDGKRHGNGTLQFKNGGVYAGKWQDDEINGYGIFSFKNAVYCNKDSCISRWSDSIFAGSNSLSTS